MLGSTHLGSAVTAASRDGRDEGVQVAQMHAVVLYVWCGVGLGVECLGLHELFLWGGVPFLC